MGLRVLCCNPNGGAFFYITKGWENAFRSLGHKFQRWKGDEEHLHKYRPHLYLGCSGWRQNLPQWARNKFGTKVGIHINPWGTTILRALPGEPNINESEDAKKWTISQNPDFAYCYGGSHDITHIWNHWTDKAGIPVVPMPTGGDAVAHTVMNPHPSYLCDVGFIGGRWPYKSINLNKYLVPVLNNTNSIIYGWGGWQGHKSYCGPIKNNKVNLLFSSAKVCPAVVEPHTARYGIDIPERMFKIPLGGGFVVCDPVKNLNKHVPLETFPMANNSKHYGELISYYLKNSKDRLNLKQQQRLEILKNHTYFSRIQGFLNVIERRDLSAKAQKRVELLVNEVVRGKD